MGGHALHNYQCTPLNLPPRTPSPSSSPPGWRWGVSLSVGWGGVGLVVQWGGVSRSGVVGLGVRGGVGRAVSSFSSFRSSLGMSDTKGYEPEDKPASVQGQLSILETFRPKSGTVLVLQIGRSSRSCFERLFSTSKLTDSYLTPCMST